MRLSRRILLVIVICAFAVHVSKASVRVHREISVFESTVREAEYQLGQGVADAAARVYSTVGERAARDLVAYVNSRESHVELRWVWLDAFEPAAAAPHADGELLARVAAGHVQARRLKSKGRADIMQIYVPVPLQGSRKAAIEVERRLDDEQDHIHQIMVHEAVSSIIAVAAGATAVLWFTRRYIGAPIRLVHEKARRIGRGDLSGDLHVTQADELGDLAAEINAMCHRLREAQTKVLDETAARVQAVERLRHADRLSTIGTIAAGVAHEIGTPLAIVRSRAQMMADEADSDGELRENIRQIQEQAVRMESIIRALLDFARLKPPQREPADLTAVLRTALRLVEPMARRSSVTVQLRAEEPVPAHVDAFQFQQVITNLVVNGIQAMPGGGTLRVEVEKADGAVALHVRDSGEGIPPGDEQRIFEPFYTTKPAGAGTGLGLTIVQEIVREHGGTIAAKSTRGGGSTFTILLPTGTA
jgi:signal transduction histidine kinase